MGWAQIQGVDVKTISDIPANQLPNDVKFYITSKSKTLYQSLIDQDVQGKTTPSVITNSTTQYYPMTSTPNAATIRHTYSDFGVYDLPAPTAGKYFTFVNEHSWPTNGTNIVITSSNQVIYWESGGIDYSANIATGTYTLSTLISAITSAMDGAADPNTYTASISFASRRYTIARASGANTFRFRFDTYNTNSAATVLGILPTAQVVGTSFQSEPHNFGMRIRPANGHKILYRNATIEGLGYIELLQRGASITIVGLDSTTWLALDAIEDLTWKNTTLGISQDIALFGRNTWITKNNLPGTLRSQAAFDLNGYGYNVNGLYNGSPVSSLIQYNDISDSWTTKGSTSNTHLVPAAFTLNNYGYMAGGGNSGGPYYDTVDKYNAISDTWSTAAILAVSRVNPTGFMLNGYGYCVGGEHAPADFSSINEQYNDTLNTWTTKAFLPAGRRELNSFVLNGYSYLVNGTTSGGTVSFCTQYNDSSDTWITKGNDTVIKSNHVAFACNQLGYSVCGFNAGFGYVCSVEQYNDALNGWITVTRPNVAARYVFGGFMINGYGYISGGISSAGTLSSVEQYN